MTSVNQRSVVIETALLPWVFEGMDGSKRINVLDVGPAMPGTIEVLNSTRCRIYIADLFDSAIIEQQHNLDQDALTARFAEALWMLDGPLHVCLLWDFPNHLTPEALEAFNRALSPWVTPRTRAHAFCAVKRSAPHMQHHYAIRSANEVVQTAAPECPAAAYPHPWRRLVSALDLFDVARGALRAGGLVEVILQSVAQQAAQPPLQASGNVMDLPLRPSANGEQRPLPARRAGRQSTPSRQPSAPRAIGQ